MFKTFTHRCARCSDLVQLQQGQEEAKHKTNYKTRGTNDKEIKRFITSTFYLMKLSVNYACFRPWFTCTCGPVSLCLAQFGLWTTCLRFICKERDNCSVPTLQTC